MPTDLEKLTELARKIVMTPQEQEDQRRSFAYGSALIENENITKEAIARAADEMSQGRKQIVDQRSDAQV
ncbi:hypothetical protein HNR60_001181 [Rhodopseudomonas rhenobacensis]|uniref:Uncharacterized protein n=1 Tax=Rhodopseudomonas rhenobacensis TaxID=87461 RepID=A0A7W7Z1T0_9BRAD|nr:hypothetical protein [Rhodopseudomonas rhenobacensis]MBB5046436.1 hypothetical protein [Rhodopseudomonas rhenobacensis]